MTSRSRRVVALLSVTAAALAPLVVVGPSRAEGTDTAIDLGAVTKTQVVTRTHLNADGTPVVADERTVTLKVEQTTNLRSRQPVRISWTGAHPTGALVADPQAPTAANQEYPFVLMQCRGTDSDAVPLAQRVRPETCWTGTSRERVLNDTSTGFGPWRLDRYETAANRTRSVGVPDPLPPTCSETFAKSERWLHFLSADGKDYGTNGDECLPAPPEAQVVTSQNQPANTTYAVTDLDGTGSTKFTMWTSEDNASLGCTDKVACTLVAVPIVGVSCDVAGAALPAADRAPSGATAAAVDKACRADGEYKAGATRIGGSVARTVTGAMWFTESHWRNRISVPLSFAPLNNVCDITAPRPGVDVYGSELVSQMTSQWRPAFCLDAARAPFKHVQVGEPQAANLLKASNIDAAFVVDPPAEGYGRPVVQSPVALTGFSISYTVDGEDLAPYRKLRMTPRLLAKLLTESYPGLDLVKDEYPALSRNPLNITLDPEFQALNPGIKKGVNDSAAAATLLNLSSDSDVELALTRYIAADPEAADWLNGVPDPWGMVVNPNYSTNPRRKSPFTLPVNNWPLRDAFMPTKFYASSPDVCLREDPVPFLPLIAAPTSRLATTAANLQFANSTPQLVCQSFADLGGKGAKLVAQGRQTPGRRFLIGVTALGDARRYALDVAQLQTYVAPTASETFDTDTGRTFVAGDTDGLRAAARLLKADDDAGVWRLPYDRITTDASAKDAYPGTMLVSLAVPTSGLGATAKRALGQLLGFAAGAGQTAGLAVGQLPPGYLPLTAGNGLAPQRSFSLRAASAVAAQQGETPALLQAAAPSQTPVASVRPGTPSTVGSSELPPFGLGGSSGSEGTGGTGTGLPIVTPGVQPVPVTSGRPVPPVTAIAVSGSTQRVSSGVAQSVFPLLALAGLLSMWSAFVIDRRGRQSSVR